MDIFQDTLFDYDYDYGFVLDSWIFTNVVFNNIRAKYTIANCILYNNINYVYNFFNYTHNEIFVSPLTSSRMYASFIPFHVSLGIFKIIQKYCFISFNMFLLIFYHSCEIMLYTRSKIILLIVMNPYPNYGYITAYSSEYIHIIWYFVLNELFNLIHSHCHSVQVVGLISIALFLTYIYLNVAYMWHINNCNKCKTVCYFLCNLIPIWNHRFFFSIIVYVYLVISLKCLFYFVDYLFQSCHLSHNAKNRVIIAIPCHLYWLHCLKELTFHYYMYFTDCNLLYCILYYIDGDLSCILGRLNLRNKSHPSRKVCYATIVSFPILTICDDGG